MTQYTMMSGVLHARAIEGQEWTAVPAEIVLDMARQYGQPTEAEAYWKGAYDRMAGRNAELNRIKGDLIETLTACEAYFDNRSDVQDGDYGIPEPNAEMRLLSDIRSSIARAERII